LGEEQDVHAPRGERYGLAFPPSVAAAARRHTVASDIHTVR
jgi:hypothetical protein